MEELVEFLSPNTFTSLCLCELYINPPLPFPVSESYFISLQLHILITKFRTIPPSEFSSQITNLSDQSKSASVFHTIIILKRFKIFHKHGLRNPTIKKPKWLSAAVLTFGSLVLQRLYPYGSSIYL